MSNDVLRVIEARPVEEEKKKDLILKMESIPSNYDILNLVWPVIEPYVKELSDQSYGEFKPYNVYWELENGITHLILGYLTDDDEAYKKGNGKKIFAGYVIVRLEQGAFHVSQVYIKEEFRNTNVLELGYKYLEEKARFVKAPFMTLSCPTNRAWDKLVKDIGFKETFTIYRKEIRANG